MESDAALERARFSLDDPEAGRKLAANLDARKVRLVFSELCAHFACGTYDERLKLRAFLRKLHEERVVVEVLPNLFCRPDMTKGESGLKARKAAVEKIAKIRRSGGKDVARRDAEARVLHAFIVAQGGTVKTGAVTEEAARLGFPAGRASYILQHLRAIGLVASNGYGTLKLVPSKPAAPAAPEGLKTDDA